MCRYKGFADRFALAVKESYPHANQREIGRRLGVSNVTVSQWLAGNKLPSAARMVELAEKLGVGHEWLATGRGEMHPIQDGDFVDLRGLPFAVQAAVREMVCAYRTHTHK